MFLFEIIKQIIPTNRSLAHINSDVLQLILNFVIGDVQNK